MKKTLLLLALSGFNIPQAQNDRITTRGTIGWFNYFGTVKLSAKWGVHTEYQWRRDQVIASWQQSLLRVGINHQLTPSVLLRGGYGWTRLLPRLDFAALAAAGKQWLGYSDFTAFQLAALARAGMVTFAHEPVKSMNWPAMSMAFKVKDKMLFDKLADGRKVEFEFAAEGKDYVLKSVK